MEHNPATAKAATCKCCGASFRPGRRSKTYCDSACKQTAYYRRKTARSSAGEPEAAPVTETPTYLNHSTAMEQPQDYRPYDTDASEQQGEQPISIMGMDVNPQLFAGILKTLPYQQQRRLSLLLIQTIAELFPDLADNEENGLSGIDYDGSANEQPQDDGQENGEWFRLDDEENAENAEDYEGDKRAIAYDEEPEPASGPAGSYYSSGKHAAGVQPHLPTHEQQMQPGGYLSRFVSPRIRRGLSVWEELAITIPSFLEAYLSGSARQAGMLVEPARPAQGGFVTLHLLFHRTRHRRPVCRLLDLVLEAEDGTLSERDFKPGGAFASSGEADRPSARDGQSQHGSDAGGPQIDYDCSETGTFWQQGPPSAGPYVSGDDITRHASTRAVSQLVRASLSKAA